MLRALEEEEQVLDIKKTRRTEEYIAARREKVDRIYEVSGAACFSKILGTASPALTHINPCRSVKGRKFSISKGLTL